MTRIRLISPRVEPPLDKPVQWFQANGVSMVLAKVRPPTWAIAWCLPAQLDGTVSGPVHSLEPVELPAIGEDVRLRAAGIWRFGYRDATDAWWWYSREGGPKACTPDAWRPLPDDEPGDAELLARERQRCADACASIIGGYREQGRDAIRGCIAAIGRLP